MNRFNVKIVISAFLIAAAVVWLAGRVRYSKPGSDELDCWHSELDLIEFHKTNPVATTREVVIKTSEDILSNPTSSRDDMHLANRALFAALDAQTAERHAEQVWSDKLKVLGNQRHQIQAKYNLTAEILIAISAALGLLLFITKPAKTTNLSKL
jgi:hypothetical protein